MFSKRRVFSIVKRHGYNYARKQVTSLVIRKTVSVFEQQLEKRVAAIVDQRLAEILESRMDDLFEEKLESVTTGDWRGLLQHHAVRRKSTATRKESMVKKQDQSTRSRDVEAAARRASLRSNKEWVAESVVEEGSRRSPRWKEVGWKKEVNKKEVKARKSRRGTMRSKRVGARS
ncbi:uncharacterized protein KY384_004684 [Bacidia gigantensis]|uniref:uncharacterized protein n=1 Tax=Bacidia gigantensis TaxID=2732470 RepID=UPI001D03F181|nr:uncharacterized protein KY384_004684 [Bacidia gigantensis]KAG8530646.1 hypothetical protein KY384_004684 [Bacidia gigantensis]